MEARPSAEEGQSACLGSSSLLCCTLVAFAMHMASRPRMGHRPDGRHAGMHARCGKGELLKKEGPDYLTKSRSKELALAAAATATLLGAH